MIWYLIIVLETIGLGSSGTFRKTSLRDQAADQYSILCQYYFFHNLITFIHFFFITILKGFGSKMNYLLFTAYWIIVNWLFFENCLKKFKFCLWLTWITNFFQVLFNFDQYFFSDCRVHEYRRSSRLIPINNSSLINFENGHNNQRD